MKLYLYELNLTKSFNRKLIFEIQIRLMNYQNEIEKAKKELINLFLKITITNKEEVYKSLLISFNY